jgi:8-amino-7-oxononanoate synthase
MSKYFQEMTSNNLYAIDVEHYFHDRTFSSCGKIFSDFCSTNYLGIDYREELFTASADFLRQWGSLTQWARLEADCNIFMQLESTIADMLGYSKVLLSHTISNSCTSNIPTIVGRNALMICDTYLHPVVKTGCKLASLKSRVVKFDVNNLNHLEGILKENQYVERKFIFVDGVHSLGRYIAPITELQYLCKKYNSWLFVDDAHGFGILGENSSPSNPWGSGGGGVIKFSGGNSHRTFYTSSFGKAFCTHTAFMAIPDEYENNIAIDADHYIYSAPVSPSLVGMVHAALKINTQSGDEIRQDLHAKIRYFIEGLAKLNIAYYSVNNHPAIHVICGKIDNVYRWNSILFEHGVFAGIRVFPLTPKNESGFRFAITATNTYEQLDNALKALSLCCSAQS